MAGWLERRRREVRAKNREPFVPMHLAFPLFLVAVFVVPWLARPFIIERFIARDPGWLTPSRSDLVVAEYLFGGYSQDQYATFLLQLLVVSSALGVAVGFLLLRRFLPDIARGAPIPNAPMWLRVFLDIYLAVPTYLALAIILAWATGVWGDDALLSGLLSFVVFGGYLLGSTSAKAAIGVWWHRALKRIRDARAAAQSTRS